MVLLQSSILPAAAFSVDGLFDGWGNQMLQGANVIWAWLNAQFQTIANWTSILGLFITVVVFLKLGSLKAALLAKEIEGIHEDLFLIVLGKLEAKPRLTESHARDIAHLLRRIRLYRVTRFSFRHRRIRKLMHDIESDVEKGVSPDAMKNQIEALQVEIRHLD